MKRFLGAQAAAFDEALGERGVVEIGNAEYPPGAAPARGLLRLRRMGPGGVAVEVDPAAGVASGDARLSVLFGMGACMFVDSDDLSRFWAGPVAAAFGLLAHPALEPSRRLLEDIAPRPPAAPASRQRGRAEVSRPARRRADGGSVPRPRRLTRRSLTEALAIRAATSSEETEALVDVVLRRALRIAPRRPTSVLVLGERWVVDLVTDAVHDAIQRVGATSAPRFVLDCVDFVDDVDLRRLTGATPGTVGYAARPPFLDAAATPGATVVVRDLDRASPRLVDLLAAFLDSGSLTAPDGSSADCRGALVLLSSSAPTGSVEVALATAPDAPFLREREVRAALLSGGLPASIVETVDRVVALTAPASGERATTLAREAILACAAEFGISLREVPAAVCEAVADRWRLLAPERSGYRDRVVLDVLGDAFVRAAARRVRGEAVLSPGPPPAVVALCDTRPAAG